MEWWKERKDVLVREKTRLDQKYPNNDFQFQIEDGYLWLKGSVQIIEDSEFKFVFDCKYPKSYPFYPPFIYPRDKQTGWVDGHQFILNGRFCLDLREHNWHSNLSAVDIIESMKTLISASYEKYLTKAEKLNVLEGIEPTLLESKTKEIRCLYELGSDTFVEDSGLVYFYKFKDVGDNRIIAIKYFEIDDTDQLLKLIKSKLYYAFNQVPTFNKIPYFKLSSVSIDKLLNCSTNEELFKTFDENTEFKTDFFLKQIDELKNEYLIVCNELNIPTVLIKLSKKKLEFYGCYAIDLSKLFSRIPENFNHVDLANKKVTIIGCGSGGSIISENIVKSGIGKLVLIDQEILEVENVVRHSCTLKDIGLKKTFALKKRLKSINPNIEIQTIENKIESFSEYISTILKDSDLVINAIGAFESVINAYTFINKIPTIHCKVYPYGFGGEVFRIIPEVTPCYDCMYRYLNNELECVNKFSDFPHNQTINYNTTIEGETIPIPSLAVDAGFVINIASKMAIELLTSNKEDLKSKPNIILWGNKKEWIFNEDYNCVKVSTDTCKSYHNCIVCYNHDSILKEVNMDETAIEDYYTTIQITK